MTRRLSALRILAAVLVATAGAIALPGAALGVAGAEDPISVSAGSTAAARFSPAPGTAGAFRLGYEDPEVAARDAARYRVIVLNPDAARHIATIRRNNPAALVLMYQEASFTTTWDPEGISRGVGYEEASANPEWFLTDRAGRRIESPWWPDNFLMDVSSPSYQRAWATNVAAELGSADWDGVFVDDVNWRANFAGEVPAKFPTDARWRAATRSFLEAVMPTVRRGGNLAILNIGEGHSAPDVWADWLQFADGAMEEHFTNWSDKVGGPYVYDWGTSSGWRAQLENLRTAVRMGKMSLLRVGGPEGDVEAMRYGLATYHLVSDGRQYIAPPRFAGPPTYPEQTWDLGTPSGDHREIQPRVHRRDFSAGLILVNASNDRTVEIPLGGTYLDHAGRTVTSVTLGPTRGAILRKVDGTGRGPATPAPPRTEPSPPGMRLDSASSYVRTALSKLDPVAPPVNGWGAFSRDASNGETGDDDGRPLQLAGTKYRTGLGVHADSELRFSVGADCRLSAVIGLDDEAGPNGSVVFEVSDGSRVRYRSDVMRAGSAPVRIDVDLRGASELRLVVDPTGDGNEDDHADWADAHLACAEG